MKQEPQEFTDETIGLHENLNTDENIGKDINVNTDENVGTEENINTDENMSIDENFNTDENIGKDENVNTGENIDNINTNKNAGKDENIDIDACLNEFPSGSKPSHEKYQTRGLKRKRLLNDEGKETEDLSTETVHELMTRPTVVAEQDIVLKQVNNIDLNCHLIMIFHF